MRKRVGVINVIVTIREQQAKKVNAVLSAHADLVIGRMGIPYPEEKINIIALVVHGTTDEIGALTGQLGVIQGVQVKSLLNGEQYKKREKKSDA